MEKNGSEVWRIYPHLLSKISPFQRDENIKSTIYVSVYTYMNYEYGVGYCNILLMCAGDEWGTRTRIKTTACCLLFYLFYSMTAVDCL